MNIKKNYLSFSAKVLLFSAFLISAGTSVFAQTSVQSSKVPKDFFANYKIQNNWDRLLELFIDIDANSKLGKLNGTTSYTELAGIMKKVFPYFPQDYNFQVTYKQCISTTETMGGSSDRSNFNSFYENCRKPLQQLMNLIDSKYTIKAATSINPSRGPAPLTVTFDARASSDPSNETIPEKNYFWYYRDIDGVDKTIGIGPVVNHTFKEQGTYQVHLTVRSSNEGIFDGRKTTSVVVSPKSAVVTIYTNGKKMNRNKALKIWIQEAKKGVLFDGTATLPMGGRQILNHRWEVSSRDGFSWNRSNDGKPWVINLPLPGQGEFSIKLSVGDNERNSITEQYSLIVSDPVAIIKHTPEKANTSTMLSFSSDASYSLTSRIKLYTRDIFDSDGVKLDTLQGKNIKKQFKKPGNYTVKLTIEDAIGQKNIDTVNLYIESTPPTPQYTITPTNKWIYPSEFFLDAKSSHDIDVGNGFDSLSYHWSFSNPNAVQIKETEEENRKITLVFNEIGKHLVTLQVSDKYGKTSEITKEIIVESTIRPELLIRPKASLWGKYISFVIKTNVAIINYEWDFGDGTTPRVNKASYMKHEYARVGSYTVKVKTTDENWNHNIVQGRVFIGEKDSPIIGYELKDNKGFTMTQNDFCKIPNEKEPGKEIEHAAYRVERQSPFTIFTHDSVNAQGYKNQLAYYFQAKNDEIIKGMQFSYRFNSMGCQYIDYTLEDTSLGKSTQQRIWFKVINSLPSLDNVTLSFPQYGNEIGIGFQENNVTKDIFASGMDPIIIRVNAQGAVDKDGVISYFKWYYYPKDNPNQILETKVTPGNIPYSFFSVPKQPGEFMFGVKMFDNDDGAQSSEELIGNGPIVIFPQSTSQPDIPLVTLKIDKINAEVGDEITFDVITKVLSERADFVKERTIEIDFEGDGEIDLVTKEDRIRHVYTKASPVNEPYRPKVRVIYRNYPGETVGNDVVIKNGIRPWLIYTSLGNNVLFKDISLGNIIERKVCLDTRECEKGNPKYLNTSLDKTFKVKYPGPGSYKVSIEAKDEHHNEAKNEHTIIIPEQQKIKPIIPGAYFVTLPESTTSENGMPEIFVGRQLNNEVLFYLYNDKTIKSCFIDIDISSDSDKDGIPDNDKDFSCNSLFTKAYTPKYESVIGRIHLTREQQNGKDQLIKKDFIVSFADFAHTMDEYYLKQYHAINKLINSIDDKKNIANSDLKTLLVLLRNTVNDKNKMRGNLIAIEEFVEKKTIIISEKEHELLESIIEALSDHATRSAKGANKQENARDEILALLPPGLKEEIWKRFWRFYTLNEQDDISDPQEARQRSLEDILEILENHSVEGTMIEAEQIDKRDFYDTVKPNICIIMEEFGIVSQTCSEVGRNNEEIKYEKPKIEKEKTLKSSPFPSWLKWILWTVGSISAVFIGIIIVFAIKAKIKEHHEEEDDG